MIKIALKTIFIGIFFLSTNIVKAVEKPAFHEGYVVTLDKDTLFGKIKYINPAFNEIKVKFIGENGKKETYTTYDLSEYAFKAKVFDEKLGRKTDQWIHYFRKRVEVSPTRTGSHDVFLKRELKGTITLYHYYVIEASKINQRGYSHCYYVEQNGLAGFGLKKVTRENYRELVRELVDGNKDLYDNLGSVGFGYAYFHDIVSQQNIWLDGEYIPEGVLTQVKFDK